ncbi:MAG: DUF1294 domain-containing protein [Sphaerospermopsis sp. SIO1G2]|nr:DUF1294 domain-containing protein [Sphaerospermopsis sp. SIO1G2]
MYFIDKFILFVKDVPTLHLLIYLALVNLITFLAYRKDKQAARFSEWRIPESTLHLLMLAGGTPAAFIAQRVLRHKTRKQPFQLVFWFLLLMQIVAALYVMTV